MKSELTFICSNCGHQTDYLNLYEATDKLVELSKTLTTYHPESLRRLKRTGKVQPKEIERGLYFLLEEIAALAKYLDELRTNTNIPVGGYNDN